MQSAASHRLTSPSIGPFLNHPLPNRPPRRSLCRRTLLPKRKLPRSFAHVVKCCLAPASAVSRSSQLPAEGARAALGRPHRPPPAPRTQPAPPHLRHRPLLKIPSDSSVSVKDPTGRILLMTQSGGKLTALDSTCTHQGCTVAPDGSQLMCPCHGSEYSLTGAVKRGPATIALHTVAVKVTGDQVSLA
jgi:nitrite reductase/ring-hydroxylating ferredoxin subunit